MYITHIETAFGDTFFPEIEEEKWSTEEVIMTNFKDDKNP